MKGWHLTAGRANLARLAGHWLTAAALAFVGWYCWGFQHIPEPVQQLATFVLHQLWQRGWRVERPAVVIDAVYVAVYAALWALFRLWRRIITVVLSPLLWRRSAVRFTADIVTVGPLFRRRTIDRAAVDRHGGVSLGFTLEPDPKLDERLAKPLAPAVAAFFRQTQFLVLQQGDVSVPVTSFGVKRQGERFLQVCRYSHAYALTVQTPKLADVQATPKPTTKRKNV